MDFSLIMGLLGGLALFLYGMQMMSSGLESVAGNKMKVILEKLTANRFVGVLVGALITAVIHAIFEGISVYILTPMVLTSETAIGSAAFIALSGTFVHHLLDSIITIPILIALKKAKVIKINRNF